MSLFEKLKAGLTKTKKLFLTDIEEIFSRNHIDASAWEELEALLIAADTGPVFANTLIAKLKKLAGSTGVVDAVSLKEMLKDTMRETLALSNSGAYEISSDKLNAIIVVGVNGTGKTTIIGKLAYQLKSTGLAVTLVAADTFRAAAIEQLEVWARRLNAPIIKQKENANPVAVVFDAIRAAKASKTNVLLIDTAGRIHTKANLMEELKKMKRILERELQDEASLNILLVLDATTGQNALMQAKTFHEAIGVTGIALTKLDGTAKGGIVLRIASELSIPVRYIGVGEAIEDIQPFDSQKFITALLG